MENKEMREEDKMIWSAINSQEKNFKRIDKNAVILFILVTIALVIAIVK